MRVKLATLGSTAALVLALGTASAQPASAAPAAGWDRCPNGSFCVFDGRNGTGTIAWFRSGSPDLRGQSMDNRTTSYWNRNGDQWALYDGYNYGTGCFTVHAGAQADLPTRFPSLDNVFSSLQKGGCG
ncbi:peptidase inhibitor family I36 protein [Streptomyces atriruber]|uniref:peptidase inhibitor family I36 protein n=1 Tax=Streptomyces atriruber TaxID=545121 RepID=UPI0006E13B8C|nr:peptidase inhibitor family I36 protein [Streptomyces atriruber]